MTQLNLAIATPTTKFVAARGRHPYGPYMNPPTWMVNDLLPIWREAVERVIEESGMDRTKSTTFAAAVSIFKNLVKKHGGEGVVISKSGKTV